MRGVKKKYTKTKVILLMTFAAGLAVLAFFGFSRSDFNDVFSDMKFGYLRLAAPSPQQKIAKIKPFSMTYMSYDNSKQIFSFNFNLVAKDTEYQKFLQYHEPKLRDAYIERLYGADTVSGMLENGIINISVLKQEILATTRRTLGIDAVDSVLILGVSQSKPL